MPDRLLASLHFQYPFRLYQQQIIDRVDVVNHTDSRFHIIAPPGSGKTVVGIELLRRIGEPTVVFAPNTTIQLQWRKQVELFLSSDNKHLLDSIVSLDPHNLKAINIFTYQLISTPDQDNELLDQAAFSLWLTDLIENRIVLTQQEASQRIKQLKKQNAKGYLEEMLRYRKAAKNNMLTMDVTKLESLLHANAQKLIRDLVNHGIKTIILDEVHHLLDYWAVTIKTLAQKIPDVHLIGLTATPPQSASNREKENYLALMGDIDYEIPAPAVVKEGNLAPYQDLLYICEPTPKEKEFIHNIQLHFDEFIVSLSRSDQFVAFIKEIIIKATDLDGWRLFIKKDPAFAQAIGRYLVAAKIDKQKGLLILPEMKKELTLDDWSILLKQYSLEYLKLHNDPLYRDTLDQIKAVLRMFGYSLSEAGIQSYRSPSELILSYSLAKTESVGTILESEMQSLGQNLRAVVITDFEKMNISARKRVKDVLDEEAGGAVGIFRHIVNSPQITQLEPILITGQHVLVDSHKLSTIVNSMKQWQKIHSYEFTLEVADTGFEAIKEVTGQGKDWKSSVYVQMVTDLFEKGIIRCIVGTRGLIGEGWNSLRLNTLIDVTCVASSTSTNQIRGRALRLDAMWPQKLANIWYVTCVDPSFAKGDHDFLRIAKKHSFFYGLDSSGKVVKGLPHIDDSLAFTLVTKGFKQLLIPLHNQRMLSKSRQREAIRQLWQIGKPYQNIELAGLSINRKQVRIKTVYALKDTVASMSLAAGQSMFGFTLWYLQNYYQVLNTFVPYSWTPQMTQIGLMGFLIAIQVQAGYKFKRLYDKVITGIPVDTYVKDIAYAVVKALAESKLIQPTIDLDRVSVRSGTGKRLYIEMSNIPSSDSYIINEALSDVFSPVIDQRYLIERSLNRLPFGLLSPLWWVGYSISKLLGLVKPSYHPVPDILATQKNKAIIFAKYWRRYVGGGSLIYTRTTKGSRKLLQLREYNSHEFEKMTYETWQ
jgi:superfamily II DNA or RNA helicase